MDRSAKGRLDFLIRGGDDMKSSMSEPLERAYRIDSLIKFRATTIFGSEI